MTLQIAVVGDAVKLTRLSDALASHPNAHVLITAGSAEYSYSLLRQNSAVDTVLIDPLADQFDPYKSSQFILETRVTHPDIAIVLLVSDEELRADLHRFPHELRQRIGHYFRIDPSAAGPDLDAQVDQAVQQCVRWHAEAGRHPRDRPYVYDIALSFAGEDRDFARDLDEILTERGVRVFYDDDKKALLWGKNLYTTLYDVYANQSRFCVLLVSAAYRDKMWTNHERAAAQARALEMRGQEYILPIRIEDVTIQGVPPTIAALPASLGAARIADLVIEKIAASV
ncbi:hypothetical protein BJ973_002838 [Actinoplanes tereljensis]|uniref:TIR domain-containing protein n=1 Tax=Paractinoplanes tereljensis TaxID=571912 RepID=A0A919NRZ9_9ACTN|nr:TIR domain-containing protein [Actinoplanes tereljensis]GIF22512.1 hypothetical protein Ate02nite_52420 [Actinoplanes tereljensis]